MCKIEGKDTILELHCMIFSTIVKGPFRQTMVITTVEVNLENIQTVCLFNYERINVS